MELVSQREYARRRGVSPMAVNRAIKAGRISTIEGKIDPEQADREWAEHTIVRIAAKPKKKLVGDTGYARSRAVRERYQARLARLDLQRQEGILVRANEVRAAVFDANRRTRDQLISLPERVAAILAATTDPAEIQRILDDEIERVCQELSNAEWV